MTEVVTQALALWGMPEASVRLVAARENAVYEIHNRGTRFALRLHRKGYRTREELQSELEWMSAMAKSGLSVPLPIVSKSSQFLHVIDGHQVDLLTWLSGETLEEALLAFPDRAGLFYELGRNMARLHEFSDAWTAPGKFERVAWDDHGLVGDAPVWGPFWENPALSQHERMLLGRFKDFALKRLLEMAQPLDYGLIHADLVAANVLVDGPSLHVIDFDDGGYGYRLFDVATALLKHQSQPDFDGLKLALLDGYQSVRGLDLGELPLFMALRAVTYVGWNIPRMNEDASGTRNARFISVALEAVKAVLGETST